ncbi:Solitary outer membrane autotransporter beta-barrel domain [Vibrio chagasii]|nr:Solitary outer membrane autotransporter beta-barrel domain [Vibrio chagasii]
MHEYKNSYSQAFQSQLDGYALNTSAWALIGEPSVKLKYLQKQEWEVGMFHQERVISMERDGAKPMIAISAA